MPATRQMGSRNSDCLPTETLTSPAEKTVGSAQKSYDRTARLRRQLAAGAWKLTEEDLSRHFGVEQVCSEGFLSWLIIYSNHDLSFIEAMDKIKMACKERRSRHESKNNLPNRRIFAPVDIQKAIELSRLTQERKAPSRKGRSDPLPQLTPVTPQQRIEESPLPAPEQGLSSPRRSSRPKKRARSGDEDLDWRKAYAGIGARKTKRQREMSQEETESNNPGQIFDGDGLFAEVESLITEVQQNDDNAARTVLKPVDASVGPASPTLSTGPARSMATASQPGAGISPDSSSGKSAAVSRRKSREASSGMALMSPPATDASTATGGQRKTPTTPTPSGTRTCLPNGQKSTSHYGPSGTTSASMTDMSDKIKSSARTAGSLKVQDELCDGSVTRLGTAILTKSPSAAGSTCSRKNMEEAIASIRPGGQISLTAIKLVLQAFRPPSDRCLFLGTSNFSSSRPPVLEERSDTDSIDIDCVISPVRDQCQWTVASFDLPSRTINYFNSFHQGNNIEASIRKYATVIDSWAGVGGEPKWQFEILNGPRQACSDACGVSMLVFCIYLLAKRPLPPQIDAESWAEVFSYMLQERLPGKSDRESTAKLFDVQQAEENGSSPVIETLRRDADLIKKIYSLQSDNSISSILRFYTEAFQSAVSNIRTEIAKFEAYKSRLRAWETDMESDSVLGRKTRMLELLKGEADDTEKKLQDLSQDSASLVEKIRIIEIGVNIAAGVQSQRKLMLKEMVSRFADVAESVILASLKKIADAQADIQQARDLSESISHLQDT